MKSKKTVIKSLLACLLILCFSCKKADYSPIENSIYIANANNINSTLINLDNIDLIVPFQVRASKKVSENQSVKVVVDENVLTSYNLNNFSDYTILPKELYTFDTDQSVIKAGQTLGSLINIDVKPLSPALLKSGLSYAIPLRIVSGEGNVPLLQTGSTFLYIVIPTPYTEVPVLKRANGMKMTLANKSVTVNDFTVEFLVNISNLALNKNNQILFNAADYASSAGGTDGEIFTRFAADGAAGKWDKLQIKNQGKSYDAVTSFVNNKWYHVAFVNNNVTGKMNIYVNGILDSSFDNAKLPTTVDSSSPRGFRFCGESDNDSYMVSNVQTAEIRFWSVARTESEIKNNMYGVKPTSKGLIGYWRCNEGSGNIIKDVSGNNNNAVIFGANANWLINQNLSVGK